MNKLFYILLFFTLTFPLSAQTKIKDTLLFEAFRSYNNGLRSSSNIFYFYQSGRIDCQTNKRDLPRKININSKKSKCFQTTPAKISELVKLAEATDFREAKEKYNLFKGGIDWGISVYITYFDEKSKKEIALNHTEFELESIPYSMQEFFRKISEIDKTMLIQYSFPKPNRNNLPQDFL